MIRYIVFDTETTGLKFQDGDKIIEIGAVELIDKKATGKTFHQLINPERKIPEDVVNLTHITDDIVAEQPIFRDVADKFLSFLNDMPNDCEKTFLVAHNAYFDISFLNYELNLAGKKKLSEYNFEIIDTLELARRKFPNNKKNSLDVLCEKFGFSLEERKKKGHGALLDSQILVDVFLKLTEEATMDTLNKDNNIDFCGFHKRPDILKSRSFSISQEELEEHKNFLKKNNIEDF